MQPKTEFQMAQAHNERQSILSHIHSSAKISHTDCAKEQLTQLSIFLTQSVKILFLVEVCVVTGQN